jgi:hypothetical protein
MDALLERADVGLDRHQIREASGTRTDLIHRIVEALRWLTQEQPHDAIGNVHGIRTEQVYPLSGVTRDLYYLRAVPHTSTGKPALQVVLLDSWMGERRCPRDVPDPDQRVFWRLTDRMTRGRAITSWSGANGGSFYSVAINVRVHPSLIRAVTYNASALACGRTRTHAERFGCPLTCAPCPERMERMGRFVVPDPWT